MSCNCLRANSIINCTDTIEIGYQATPNLDIAVYLKNVTTGRVTRYESTADGAGYFSIELNETLNEKHLYEITITESGETNPQNTLLITIDGNETCCVQFTAFAAYYMGDIDQWLTQTLTVENCESTNTPAESVVRYHQTATDYTHTPNIYIIGITDTSADRTITLCDPADFPEGQLLTVKDESGGAATHNITVSGTIEGTAFALIQADYGGVTLYSDGASTWFIESDI